MTFKDTVITEEQNEAKKITIDSFLLKVNEFSSIDDALSSLPDEYLEFYAKNEKKLQKSLENLNLAEEWTPETPGYVGFSKVEEKKVKTIKYKGGLLHLVWDPEIGTWMPFLGFRSVVQALKYAKKLADASVL